MNNDYIPTTYCPRCGQQMVPYTPFCGRCGLLVYPDYLYSKKKRNILVPILFTVLQLVFAILLFIPKCYDVTLQMSVFGMSYAQADTYSFAQASQSIFLVLFFVLIISIITVEWIGYSKYHNFRYINILMPLSETIMFAVASQKILDVSDPYSGYYVNLGTVYFIIVGILVLTTIFAILANTIPALKHKSDV